MRKIAIILPEYLPVPATKGGGVESLVNGILSQNEVTPFCTFDVYSVYDKEAVNESLNYKHSNFFFFKFHENKIKNIPLRACRKFFNQTFLFNKSYYAEIVKKLRNNIYSDIIIENKTMLVPFIKRNVPKSTKIHVHIHNRDQVRPNHTIHLESQTSSVIVVSEYVKRTVERSYPNLKKSSVRVMHNFVDSGMFHEDLDARRQLRIKYNILDNDKVVLYSGRVIKSKGIRELFKALTMLKLANVHLVVVGSSWYGANEYNPFERELKQLSLNLKNEVIFTGYVAHENMNKYYSFADVCVFPSTAPETAGLVQLESMSCSRTTIVSSSGGMPEYIGEAGSIVQLGPNFINDLAKALLKALSSTPKELEERGKCLRSNALNFSPENSFREFVHMMSS